MHAHPYTKRSLVVLIASAFPVIHALPAHAQQAAPTRLGEILVSAPADRPLPANTAAVGSADIAARRAASSDTVSLLRDVPGMSLQGAGGVSSLPIIHGLADDRVRTKVDGMDLIASSIRATSAHSRSMPESRRSASAATALPGPSWPTRHCPNLPLPDKTR